MKKLLYIIIFTITFFLGSCQFATAQDISLPRETAEKALKAIELVPKLEAENIELKNLIRELELTKQTPCSVAITAVENALNKLPIGEPTDSKAMVKSRKDREKFLRKIYSESLKSQCGWKESRRWYEYLLQLAPLLALLK